MKDASFDVTALRQEFPALHRPRDGQIPVFLDGPAGTQVPQRVLDAMLDYLTRCNANHGGVFATSRESDQVLCGAHEAMADFLNARSPDEIVFGANMTTLTFHLSRSIARLLRPGDELVVTRLDHDANVTPWVLAARDAGAVVRRVDIHPEDCMLDLDDLRSHLGPRTRLIAVCCAANAVGNLNEVRRIVRWGHEAGAWVFLDAVHYAPHGPIDVQEWDCDFLACSAYKFFGPHVGVLYGKRPLLEELSPYKVRPASDKLPERWMTGTQNHEGIAGVAAAIDYLADIGRRYPLDRDRYPELTGRRRDLRAGMCAIRDYEMVLVKRLLAALASRPRFRVWGIARPEHFAVRVPTVAITMKDRTAEEIAVYLAARQIYTWSGNMYAVLLTERLGLEERGGVLRIGLLHYNTAEEIDRLIQALDEM
jgi:cysteine desulfurase family protein (TIGR01976 family)